MATIEQISAAILRDDSLLTRALVQEFLRDQPVLADISRPETDTSTLVVAAALLELFALRTQQPAPAWTRQVGPMEQPRYLLEAATHMRRLRDLCRDAAPEPLRRRRLYAPPDYLAFA
jgi:predicted secreted protein